MLRRVALMTATYSYSIASAGATEAVWLANEVASRGRRELVEKVQAVISDVTDMSEGDEVGKEIAKIQTRLKRIISYQLDHKVEALKSVGRLAGDDRGYEAIEKELVIELERVAKAERRRGERAIKGIAEMKGLAPLPSVRQGRLRKIEAEAQDIVPRRLFKGPFSTRPWVRKLSGEDREALWRLGKDHPESRTLGTLAMYRADGERSLVEVSGLVELEAGRTDLEFLVKYFRLLGKMGLVELARAGV
jgi:hypothetical protein